MNHSWPSFDEALKDYQAYLYDQKWPKQIRWIHAGGVRYWHDQLYIRINDKFKSESEAQRIYDIGISRQLGIAMHGLCHTEDTTWAYVSSPLNQDASERLMYSLTDLKMSVFINPPKASYVSNSLYWLLLNFAGKTKGYAQGNKEY